MSDRYPQFPASAVSVTEILDACGLIYHASPEALERGQRVHEAVALMLRGRLDWNSVDERIIGYVKSAGECELQYDPLNDRKPDIEGPLCDSVLGIVGTPDLVLGHYIIDFKTGAPAPWHRAQLGGYWHLKGEPSNARLQSVYLQEDGSLPKLVEHRPSEAWREFLTCYNFYRLREQYGRNGITDNP